MSRSTHSLWKFRVDDSVKPWATYTAPEVAHVGLNEVTTYHIGVLDRALTAGEGHGIVMVLTVACRDKIPGATIAGNHAGKLSTELSPR